MSHPPLGETRGDLSGELLELLELPDQSVIDFSNLGSLVQRGAVIAEAELQVALVSSSTTNDAKSATGIPSETEKYRYLTGDFAWVMPASAVLFLPALLSLGTYALSVGIGAIFIPFIALMIVNWVLGLWSNALHSRFSVASHISKVHAYAPHQYPSVDVFLPTCGEPLEILVGVYRHVQALNWPGELAVHVLDDAGREEVRAAASYFGFKCISREDRGVLKKAGNMRHAFDQTSGDFILVLDADFSPRPEMLRELIPYFDDNIGIVQSPQFFDTTPRQSWVQYAAGATQEVFYRWVQPSRDRRNAAICVGTNAVYRREALQVIGGFCPIEHSEDVHTGFSMLQKGFVVRYVPVIVAKGLCPAELPQFISQQYRWATGSLSLSTSLRFWKAKEIPWKTRLPFLTGFLYYIITGLAALIGFAPGPLLMWFAPDLLSPINYLPFVGCYLSAHVLLPVATAGRLTPKVLRIQIAYSFAHLVAIVDAITKRTEGWVATGVARGGSKAAPRVLKLLVAACHASLVFTAGGLVHAISVVGFSRVWPASVMLVFQAWLCIPLIRAALVELRCR